MIKFAPRIFCLILFFAFVKFAGGTSIASAHWIDKAPAFKKSVRANDDEEKTAVVGTTRIIAEIVNASYPELKNAPIIVKTFHSRSDFFRSRFSFSRFLTFRKFHFLILVNPKVFAGDAPTSGIRAIIAHELAHVAYYLRHNRFELLGLINLQSKSFTARFERGADLQAIKRGYGAGLEDYREWLYKNIPARKIAAKKRDYFSPAEIDLIVQAIKEKPELIDFWITNVPLDAAEIQSAISGKISDEN